MKRFTIIGAIEIGWARGVVSISIKVSRKKIEEKKLWDEVMKI